MNEHERRQEILQAEEVIRRLAAELGRNSDTAALSEKARDALVEGSIDLQKARIALDEAKAQLGTTRDRCIADVSAACDQAREAVRTAEASFGRTIQAFDAATARLESVTKDLQDAPNRMAEVLNETQAKFTDGISKLFEAQQAGLGRLNKILWAVLAVSTGVLLLSVLRFVI